VRGAARGRRADGTGRPDAAKPRVQRSGAGLRSSIPVSGGRARGYLTPRVTTNSSRRFFAYAASSWPLSNGRSFP